MHETLKNSPVEIISKCNKKTIGIIETCDLESINEKIIYPSEEWANCSTESKNEILISVADMLEDQQAKFVYLLMHEAGKTLEDSLD